MIKKLAIVAAAVAFAGGSALAGTGDGANPTAKKAELVQVAGCNPCAAKNPCAAANPCAATNPCAAKNPCAANPCAANPCAAH